VLSAKAFDVEKGTTTESGTIRQERISSWRRNPGERKKKKTQETPPLQVAGKKKGGGKGCEEFVDPLRPCSKKTLGSLRETQKEKKRKGGTGTPLRPLAEGGD